MQKRIVAALCIFQVRAELLKPFRHPAPFAGRPPMLRASAAGLPTCVDDLALGVEVVQGDQGLAGEVANNGDGDAAVVIQPAAPQAQTCEVKLVFT